MEALIVIVGFLGSGKTTLLKKVTKDYLSYDWKPFIILNDYQNANFDSQKFLDFLDKDQIKPLSGSCICCSGVTELRDQVNSIPQRENGVTLIEANGTTDACTLMGFLGVGLKDNFLPPIQVAVVDTRNWQKRGHNNALEANQVEISSLIVLNFLDQVNEERKKEVIEDIKSKNSEATIFDWDELDTLSLSSLHPSKNRPSEFDHKKSHWSSCSVDLPEAMLSSEIERIMAEIPNSILRVKACTRLDKDAYYSFIERTPSGETFVQPFAGSLLTGPKLVAIGPGSDPDFLNQIIQRK